MCDVFFVSCSNIAHFLYLKTVVRAEFVLGGIQICTVVRYIKHASADLHNRYMLVKGASISVDS